MTVFDSRAMGPLNCFIQKITGTEDVYVEVHRAAAANLAVNAERATRLKVAPAKEGADLRGQGVTHHIAVHPDGDGFKMEAAPKELQQGDGLLFYTPDRSATDFCVVGQQGKMRFSSASLTDQTVFTQPFGTAGHYRWSDRNGSRAQGEIHVREMPSEGQKAAQEAMAMMSKGAMVHIRREKVSPKVLEIYAGQTVFFAVEDSEGMTVTGDLMRDEKR